MAGCTESAHNRKEKTLYTESITQFLQWVAEYIAEDGAAVLVNPYAEWKIVHSVEEAEFMLKTEDITAVLPL